MGATLASMAVCQRVEWVGWSDLSIPQLAGLFGRVKNTFVVSRAELVRERNDFAKQLEVCRSALARKEWVLDQYDSEISSMRWFQTGRLRTIRRFLHSFRAVQSKTS